MVENQSADVAIFWDLENVQPGEVFLIDELMAYSEQYGRVVFARAFADFHKYDPKIAQDLISAQVELLHMPHHEYQKNSVDILLAVNATNTLVLYPNVEHYVIVSGDYDFRGLVQTLQQHGKKIHMVCDPTNTRTELLRLVDTFQDMYELSDLAIERHPLLRTEEDLFNSLLKKMDTLIDRLGGSVETQVTEPVKRDEKKEKEDKIKSRARQILKEKEAEPETLRTKVTNIVDPTEDVHKKIELAMDKLQEAITQACQETNSSQADHNTVLTRLKIIYPDLEEDIKVIAPEMGFDPSNKWYSNLLRYAEQRDKIGINLEGATYYLSTEKVGESTTKKRTREFFQNIKDAIQKYGKNGQVDISRLAQVINDDYNINYSDLGYKSFKASLIEGQKRKIIDLQRSKQDMTWTVKLE